MAAHPRSAAQSAASVPAPQPAGSTRTSIDEAPVCSAAAPGARARGGGVDREDAYRQAYESAYAAVAAAVVDAALTAGAQRGDGPVRKSLDALGDAARRAGLAAVRGTRPPAGRAGVDFSGPPTWGEPRALTGEPASRLRLRGAVDGAVEAARDVVAGWRAAVSHEDRMAGFGDGTVTDWVHARLAGINREVVCRWLTDSEPLPASTAGVSFAPAGVYRGRTRGAWRGGQPRCRPWAAVGLMTAARLVRPGLVNAAAVEGFGYGG